MPRKKKLKFEDCIESIDIEINKRRGRWNIKAAATLYMKERREKKERDAFRFAKMNKVVLLHTLSN